MKNWLINKLIGFSLKDIGKLLDNEVLNKHRIKELEKLYCECDSSINCSYGECHCDYCGKLTYDSYKQKENNT